MRGMGLGLAAAAVAGVMGFGGAARATPAYVSLANNNTLTTSGGVSWLVGNCTYNGTGGCSSS